MSIAQSLAVAPLSGPCAGARTSVDSRCADAERLAQAAVAHEQRLRDVRKQLREIQSLRDADARVRDRRQLNEAKDAARSAYHQAVVKAGSQTDVHEAARVWLREVDRLNRQLAIADRRAEDVVRRASELEHALPGIELAADAARISAEAAHVSCLDARRELAACEEDAQRRMQATPPAHAAAISSTAVPGPAAGPGGAAARAMAAATEIPVAAAAGTTLETGSEHEATIAGPAPAPAPARHGVRPISLVLRGDRQTLLSLALHLSEETGIEAGRLQLLLLELRESIATRALEECAFRFPADHPFWSQFPADGSRQVAASLSSMGYRFDGRDGWTDDRVPSIRELGVALSQVGLDPRVLRRPAGQEALDALWQGTTVVVEEYLAARAPDLDLRQVMNCLGTRGGRLSELWDMWGRLRPLLLTPA